MAACLLALGAAAPAYADFPTAAPCGAMPEALSPLVRAALAGEEDRVLQRIDAGADFLECVSEREVMQLAEPRKRISYVGKPEPGYPLAVLLAVADMPSALADLTQRQPAQLHALDPHGNSALAWAARLLHVEVVKLLLGQGLDPLQTSDEKQTPLSLVLKGREKSKQKTEIVAALIGAVPRERFTSIGVVDQVWVAVFMGDFNAMQVLLEAGVPPHYVAIQGRTALLSAVEAGNLAAVRLLLAHGARVSRYPYRGKTIFEYAEDNFKDARPDAAEIQRLMAIEREKLVRLGHNPPGGAPQDWNSSGAMDNLRLLRMLK